MLKTLVLNSDMMPIKPPITEIPAQDAVTRVINGTCYVLTSYEKKILTPRPETLDLYGLRCWPAIIVRKEYLPRKWTVALTAKNVYFRDSGKCQYCGMELSLNSATMDHYVPKAHGGQNVWENVVLACHDCNNRKSDQMPGPKWKVGRAPYQPSYWELVKTRRKLPVTIGHESWKEFIGNWEGSVKVANEV